MAANDARKLELLRDAGFPDPEGALGRLQDELTALIDPAQLQAELSTLRAAIAQRTSRLPPAQATLARLTPELLLERGGDLASALWLARAQHGDGFDLTGWTLAVLDALLESGREREALALVRFLFDGRFDWSRVYGSDAGHEFLRSRDPNPLIWQLLEDLAPYRPLRVLELGCGIGNDAMGLLESPHVEAYTGIDVVPQAIDAFRQRVEGRTLHAQPRLMTADFTDVLNDPSVRGSRINCVYAYSSLHYFASGELRRLFSLVRSLLLGSGRMGFFAFGLKGTGSVWEGQGLPLYRPDVWVNWDGQSRWFPSRQALAGELDASGFEVRVHETHNHWGYSEKGKRDAFHYVVCSPRAGFIAEGI